MRKTPFLPVYFSVGSGGRTNNTTFRISGRSGVYLVKDKRINKIVYVGYSGTDLYKTMYRHFQEWNDKGERYRFVVSKSEAVNYTVRIIFCTPTQAYRLEQALIYKLQPSENEIRPGQEYRFDKPIYTRMSLAPVIEAEKFEIPF